MLGKLMKYELRATSRTMLPLLLLTLLLSVFTRMTSAVVQSGHSKFITVINTLLILAFFLALIGTAVFSVVLMVVRFRNNLMTDEGYLMFTLPVSVHQLLWSKLLVSMLWFIAVFCVDALALVLTVYEDGMFAGLPEFVRTLFDSVNREYMVNGALYMLELLGVLLVSMVTACLMFYAPIAIGNQLCNAQDAAVRRVLLRHPDRSADRHALRLFGFRGACHAAAHPRDSGQHHQDGASALYQPLCLRARHRRHFVCPDLVHAAQKTQSGNDTLRASLQPKNFGKPKISACKILFDWTRKGLQDRPFHTFPARSAHLFCFTSFGLCLRPARSSGSFPDHSRAARRSA